MLKPLLSLAFLLFFSSAAFSQDDDWDFEDMINNIVLGTNFSYEQITTDNYTFYFDTAFSVGYGNNCPPVVNTMAYIENDTLNVEIYYQLVGGFLLAGCQNTDIINYNQAIPANVTTIKMSTNVKTYGENQDNYPEEFTIFPDMYFEYFTLGNLSISENNPSPGIVIYPNPVNDVFFFKSGLDINNILIFNSLGQCVQSSKPDNKSINVSALPDGLYYVALQNGDSNIITQNKIVVKH